VNEPVNEPVLICVELDTSVGLFATLLYSIYEELIALVAQLEVPIKTPVNDPVNEPVLI
jgi:hypothetical protein